MNERTNYVRRANQFLYEAPEDEIEEVDTDETDVEEIEAGTPDDDLQEPINEEDGVELGFNDLTEEAQSRVMSAVRNAYDPPVADDNEISIGKINKALTEKPISIVLGSELKNLVGNI